MNLPPTPELDKMLSIVDEHDTQTVGDFLDWLFEAGYQICEWDGDSFAPVHKRIELWLAARHGIDLDVVEKERAAVLEAVRVNNDIRELEEIAADTAR